MYECESVCVCIYECESVCCVSFECGMSVRACVCV